MIEFKSDRIQQEYKQLLVQNQRLYRLIECLSQFTSLEFNKPLFITSILRTEAEHKELYKDTPNAPTTSPHLFWRGVDLRSTIYTDTEIQRMLKFLNCFLYQGGAKPTAIYHSIAGNAIHFHVQYA